MKKNPPNRWENWIVAKTIRGYLTFFHHDTKITAKKNPSQYPKFMDRKKE